MLTFNDHKEYMHADRQADLKPKTRERAHLSTARSVAHKRSVVPHLCKELAV